MESTAEILDRGFSYLADEMGAVEAEEFICTVIRESADYTKWQRQYFDSVDPDEFFDAAVAFDQSHPFAGNGQ